MVILKIGAGTTQEREVEIVNEKGIWESGSYHIFAANFLPEKGDVPPEPHNTESPNFLGAFDVDKENGTWLFKGDKLSAGEQKQVADFILDYRAPDAVY